MPIDIMTGVSDEQALKASGELGFTGVHLEEVWVMRVYPKCQYNVCYRQIRDVPFIFFIYS